MFGINWIIILANLFAIGTNATYISLSVDSLDLEIGETSSVTISLSTSLDQTVELYFNYDDNNTFVQSYAIVEPMPNVTIPAGSTTGLVNITGKNAGSVTIGLESLPEKLNSAGVILRVSVVRSRPLVLINAIIGWIYFVAWSISFYPQVYYNWQRKSVVGLNFDFLAYNITGFISYGVFNIGLFWIADIQRQYFAQHPRGVNPVQLNDVIFTLHAIFITTVTIIQAVIYEKGGQKVSKVSMVILSAAWLFAFITLFLSVGKVISWLTYLYFFSYIKLGVTLIKYIPQAWMNYRRKSTVGWSIGNVLLDCTGGSFSLLQMFLISYNSDDWGSIFGDPTKFGLGAFSILFDIVFIVQHYCLYRHTSGYTQINGEDKP